MQTALILKGHQVTAAEAAFIESKYDGAFTHEDVRNCLAGLRVDQSQVPFAHYGADQLPGMILVERRAVRHHRALLLTALRRYRDLKRDAADPRVARHIPNAKRGAETAAYVALQSRRDLRLMREALHVLQLPLAAE